MIFYVALDQVGHKQLCGTQTDARAIDKQFDQIDIPTDKAGLRKFVQALYDETDALRDQIFEGGEQPPEPPPTPPPPQSIDLDDLFETLPLARQLHFAAVAMENARERLK